MWCRLAVVILFFKLKFFHIVFNEGLGRGNQLYYEKLPSVCLKYENNTLNTLYAHLSWIVSYKVHCSSIHVVLYFAFCSVQFIFLILKSIVYGKLSQSASFSITSTIRLIVSWLLNIWTTFPVCLIICQSLLIVLIHILIISLNRKLLCVRLT